MRILHPVLALTCVLGITASQALAEKITLRNGKTLEGKVVTKGNTITVITEKDRLFQFAKSEILQPGEKPDTGAVAAAAAQAPAAVTITEGNPIVKITTGKGDVTVELFEDKVPNTVANIISLAEKGFYKGMRFHRIIPGFMAQGGCPHSKRGARGKAGTGGPGYRIKDELHATLKHTGPGILSMANTGAPNSGGSQFFLCFTAQPHLNGKHAVFGQVIAGLEVLKVLEALGTRSRGGEPKEYVEFDIKVVSKRDHAYQVKTL